MKLSIIVPVYNMAAEGKLAYCLNSLVSQTIKDYEIIALCKVLNITKEELFENTDNIFD